MVSWAILSASPAGLLLQGQRLQVSKDLVLIKSPLPTTGALRIRPIIEIKWLKSGSITSCEVRGISIRAQWSSRGTARMGRG